MSFFVFICTKNITRSGNLWQSKVAFFTKLSKRQTQKKLKNQVSSIDVQALYGFTYPCGAREQLSPVGLDGLT
jgi:hypothetical protein